MNEHQLQQAHSKVELSLKELETPLMETRTLEEQQQWQQQEVTKKEKPAYGAPPQEARKHGGTYVSRLKEEDRTKTTSDVQRLHVKTRLSGIAEGYRATAGDDADFLAVLDKVDAYSQIDRNALTSGTMDPSYLFDTEGNAYNAVSEALKSYVAKLIPLVEQGTATEQQQMHLNQVYQLFGYFEEQKNGYLQRPPQGAMVIDGTKRTIKTGMAAIDCDVKEKPLFPHEPCVNDIAQRALGDCFLLAGLASIVTQNPEKIKECMRDNQDGTVTVRFFSKDARGQFSPVYVTVEKKVPRVIGLADAFAGNCLWAQMIERAYAASGLHQTSDNDVREPVPENIDLRYETIASTWDQLPEGDKAELRKSTPWLFDKKGKLQKWQPHYEQIEGGYSGLFNEMLLGEEFKRELIKPTEVKSDVLKFEDRGYAIILDTLVKEKTEEEGVEEDSRSYMFSHMITEKPMEHDITKRSTEDKKETSDITNIKKYLSVYLDAHADKSHYSDLGQQVSTHIDAFIEEFKTNKPELYASPYFMTVMNFFRAEAARKSNRFTVYKPRTGQYDTTQDAMFQKIRESLDAGKYVGGGTLKFEKSDSKGKNGETGNVGIVGTHAYTILDTEVRQINGRDFKFIKIRNPWGQEIREYYTKEGTDELQVEKTVHGNQGVFLVELSDFMTNFKELEIN